MHLNCMHMVHLLHLMHLKCMHDAFNEINAFKLYANRVGTFFVTQFDFFFNLLGLLHYVEV